MVAEPVPTYPMPRDHPLAPPPCVMALHARQPVSRVRIWDGSEVWFVTGYDAQRQILSSPDFSSDARKPKYPHVSPANVARRRQSPTLSSLDNPEHAAMRRLLVPHFSRRRLGAMRAKVEKIVSDQLDVLVDHGSPADLVGTFAMPIPSLVVCQLLGLPFDEHESFQACSHRVQDSRITQLEMMEAMDELRRIVTAAMNAKANDPGDDVLTSLSQYVRTGELTRDQAADVAALLLFAGHDTTAHMISLGTLTLLLNPSQLSLLLEDTDGHMAVNAVEELLRFLTIAHLGRRRVAVRDMVVEGTLIRAGEGVICASDAGNRDPAQFAYPDELELARKNARGHLAFGFGDHQCTGQNLARMELQIVFSALFTRLPGLSLAVDVAELTFLDEMNVYGLKALPVTW